MKAILTIAIILVLGWSVYLTTQSAEKTDAQQEDVKCEYVYRLKGTMILQDTARLVNGKAKAPIGNTVTGDVPYKWGLYLDTKSPSFSSPVDEQFLLNQYTPTGTKVLDKYTLKITEERKNCPETPENNPELD